MRCGAWCCIAPPDHDLTVETGYLAVRRSAEQNRFHSVIDALFHSATHHYAASKSYSDAVVLDRRMPLQANGSR